MQTTHDAPESKQPTINITGEYVALGPWHRNILPISHKWMNDFEVTLYSGDPLQPLPMEAIEADYERMHKSERNDVVSFVIYERSSLRPIGLTGLRRIDYKNGTATLGILIGEKDCWNKGYGTETTRLILDYGFHVLGLHNIMLTTYAYNDRAIHAYTKAGFREIGRRREAHKWKGQRYDEVSMDCLVSEFQRPAHTSLKFPKEI